MLSWDDSVLAIRCPSHRWEKQRKELPVASLVKGSRSHTKRSLLWHFTAWPWIMSSVNLETAFLSPTCYPARLVTAAFSFFSLSWYSILSAPDRFLHFQNRLLPQPPKKNLLKFRPWRLLVNGTEFSIAHSLAGGLTCLIV